MSEPTAPRLIEEASKLEEVARACAAAPRLAVDGEGNGMHAYRSQLCVLQLAWETDDGLEIAIVDPLAVDLAPLAPVLGDEGPEKVLHDLTFDARMLHETGIALGHVRDTSVTARFLGEKATGLASLVEARFGVVLGKKFQKHDWAQRPFEDEHVAYLAGDVRYLLALDDRLREEARELGIEEEIALECIYKLGTAAEPPVERAPHTRVKGYRKLTPDQRTVLRHLVAEREEIAERRNVPPYKVANNGLLLTLARKSPTRVSDVRKLCRGGARRYVDAWYAAIDAGRHDPTPEVEPPPPDRPPDWAERKAIEGALSTWRRAEAESRGVDIQVVIPGHCMSPLAACLSVQAAGGAPGFNEVPGLGDVRVSRYADAWQAVAEGALAPTTESPDD